MILYYLSSILPIVTFVLFILALRGLSSAATSSMGNRLGMIGMAFAILFTLQPLYVPNMPEESMRFIVKYGSLITGTMAFGGIIGYIIAKKIKMTDLPQLLAAFHSLVGLAAVLIAVASFVRNHYIALNLSNPDIKLQAMVVFGETAQIENGRIPTGLATELILGAVIGAITFTGSIVAFGKLQGLISGKPLRFNGQHKLNLILGIVLIALIIGFVNVQSYDFFFQTIALALLIGVLLIMPIGGADMPVIISMLNSYSGWATAGIGFSMNNQILIIVGALVGTSGAILSHIMCKGMNRSLLNVIFGGFGSDNSNEEKTENGSKGNVKLCSPEDAGFILKNANSVIIVPGYGMAVAQAQHVIKELADELKKEDISVKYAIHPVAGRMPGHMNVLLAEANIPYEDVFELDDINHEFGMTDVAVVIGANDITNPAAKNDPNSPIYGMPVLDVEKAKTVLFIKRSLGSGYAGIENQLFYRDNTMMVLGDAKKVCEDIIKSVKE